MSISEGLGRYISRRKMEKRWTFRREMDVMGFISRQSWHFSFKVSVINVFFPLCTLTWRVNNFVSSQEKVQKGETKVHLVV